MSLLDRGPHSVTVTPMVTVGDSMGTTLQPGTPVAVEHIAIQPVSAEESEALGIAVSTSYRIIGRGGWPGGVHSRVLVDVGPNAGRTFDQHGDAREYGMSPRTAHFDVVIKSGSSEVR